MPLPFFFSYRLFYSVKVIFWTWSSHANRDIHPKDSFIILPIIPKNLRRAFGHVGPMGESCELLFQSRPGPPKSSPPKLAGRTNFGHPLIRGFYNFFSRSKNSCGGTFWGISPFHIWEIRGSPLLGQSHLFPFTFFITRPVEGFREIARERIFLKGGTSRGAKIRANTRRDMGGL